MSIYTFMGEHPIITFILACFLYSIASYPLRLVQLWIRHRNIVAHGWPPAHLDADGDEATPKKVKLL